MPTMVGKEKERRKERGEGDAIKNRYAQKNSGYGAAHGWQFFRGCLIEQSEFRSSNGSFAYN